MLLCPLLWTFVGSPLSCYAPVRPPPTMPYVSTPVTGRLLLASSPHDPSPSCSAFLAETNCLSLCFAFSHVMYFSSLTNLLCRACPYHAFILIVDNWNTPRISSPDRSIPSPLDRSRLLYANGDLQSRLPRKIPMVNNEIAKLQAAYDTMVYSAALRENPSQDHIAIYRVEFKRARGGAPQGGLALHLARHGTSIASLPPLLIHYIGQSSCQSTRPISERRIT